MFCIRARLYRLQKNSCFVTGHDFTCCRRTHVLYQARLYRLQKNSCFVSGHDFSRAEKAKAMRALAPGFVFPEGYGLFRLYVNALQ
jgi:uncharacterized membrane protein